MAKVPENWHAEDVKAKVRIGFGTLEALADIRGVDGAVLRAALRRPVPRGNRIIAAALGLSVHDIWPLWFDTDGNRRHASLRSGRDSRPQKCGSHRQKAEAA